MRRTSSLFYLLMVAILPAVVCLADEPSTEETEKRNKAVILKAHADLAAGDFEGFKSVISPNYTRHCQAMAPGLQEIHGTEEFFGFIEEFIKAAPGYTDSISNMIAEGDRVAYVSTMRGTQTGPMGELPATGKTFTLVNIIIQRLDDGQIAETWVSWDNLAFLSQLGLMPGPPDRSQ